MDTERLWLQMLFSSVTSASCLVSLPPKRAPALGTSMCRRTKGERDERELLGMWFRDGFCCQEL